MHDEDDDEDESWETYQQRTKEQHRALDAKIAAFIAGHQAAAEGDNPLPVGVEPAPAPAPKPGPPKRRRVRPRPAGPPRPRSPRLNWGWVAIQIARGRTPDEIAAELGCSPARIWRNYRRSKRFHDRIERERREALQQVAWRLTGKAPQILDGLLAAIDAGDLRLLLQLADRLKLQTAGQDINIVASPW